jgi:hypothetical protein
MNQNDVELETYHELCGYTLTHPDPAFIHQYVVDAFAAQRANTTTKPITLTFALVGLYFYIERKWTGRQVQRVHTLLARHRRDWPRFDLPMHRGDLTASDVIGVPAGPARDDMIQTWCAAVWQAYQGSHPQVIELIQAELG